MIICQKINSHDSLYHHGIKGQKWGVRRYQNEDGSLTLAGQKKLEKGNGGKIAAGVAGGLAVGASAVGLAWVLKNKHNTKVLKATYAARTQKANATKAARKASGYYQKFKDVDVAVTKKGSDFVKTFSNVKLAKILPR